MAFPSIFSLSSSSEEPDWAWLPQNMLFLIISQLFLLSDIVSFGSVCTPWRSVLKHRLQDLNFQPNMRFSRKLPILLIPTDDNNESTRNLYSLLSAEVYDLKLPAPYHNRCIGSSHGWLIFLESFTFAITLFNPFYFGNSKGFIRIPPFLPAGDTCEMMKALEREFFSDYFICKAILSSCNDFIMMVIHGEHGVWLITSPRMQLGHSCISTNQCYMTSYFIYFLAVNFWGEVYVCDVKSNVQPRIRLVTEPVVGPLGETMRRYIVESNDGTTLLQAVRLVECSMSSGGELFLDTTG
ncbi:hypothetical protein BVRB_3g053640 [Beta vulgaris subsp. vulgaris]|nr:hypothetical protein BVRB_3g053640 [Beta vulgaris subsp. vulgaris]